jgi:hypothetical protein
MPTTSTNPLIRKGTSTTYAQCRSLGHEWRHKGLMDGPNLRAPLGMSGSIPLRSQCADCKTWRTKWVTRSGEVITRYDYPDGYATHGDERMSSQQWRSTFVSRLFDDAPMTQVRAS